MAHISQDYDAQIEITVIDTSEEFIKAFLDNLSIKAEVTNEAAINNHSPNAGPE